MKIVAGAATRRILGAAIMGTGVTRRSTACWT
jgi:pyruvate/2-oxoglutarate dehydrogenase complex dihydrolipoamide dehydrogenase (E3) component